jgi:hypothetical protein
MNQLEIKSVKRKIAQSNDLAEIIDEMLSRWSEWPLELYFAIKHKLISGHIVDELTFARIVVVTGSKTLYESRRAHGIPSLHLLLSSRIPDESIEIRICENIEKEFYSRIPTHLRESLRLIGEFGSIQTLDYLEPLAYDNLVDHQVTKLKGNLFRELDFAVLDNQDFLVQFESISTSLKLEIYRELVEAIRNVKKRSEEFKAGYLEWSTI